MKGSLGMRNEYEIHHAYERQRGEKVRVERVKKKGIGHGYASELRCVLQCFSQVRSEVARPPCSDVDWSEFISWNSVIVIFRGEFSIDSK